MATVGGVPQELFSTLLFGDNDEFESYLGDEIAAFRARLETNSHHSNSITSPSHFPYLFLMGDEDEALIIAEEAGYDEDAPPNYTQPRKLEFMEKRLEDVRVEEKGSVCSICLDKMPMIGSRAKGLPCSHVYHGSCIGEWLKKTNTCPICRCQMPS